jgi:hypothetical protein
MQIGTSPVSSWRIQADLKPKYPLNAEEQVARIYAFVALVETLSSLNPACVLFYCNTNP